MVLNLSFPTLPMPLDSIERKRLTRKITDWSSKPANGEVLGRVFERLVRAFEFEWAWTTFTAISRHDTKTGKFTEQLPPIAEILAQHLPVEQLAAMYSLIEECLTEGWTIYAAIPGISSGFAKRRDSMQLIPILRSLSQRIDRQYLSAQVEDALSRLVPFENSKLFPHATTAFLSELVGLLQDASRIEKWTNDIENREIAAQDHERRIDLIHDAVHVAREAVAPNRPFAEAVISLIRLGECASVEAIAREVRRFSCDERTKFLYLLITGENVNLQNVNHEGAIRALTDLYLGEDEDENECVAPDWSMAYAFERLGIAAIRLGLLAWWLDCTDVFVKRFIMANQLSKLSDKLISLAANMDNSAFAHCPHDFWKSYADVMPSAELKATILSKLAVKT